MNTPSVNQNQNNDILLTRVIEGGAERGKLDHLDIIEISRNGVMERLSVDQFIHDSRFDHLGNSYARLNWIGVQYRSLPVRQMHSLPIGTSKPFTDRIADADTKYKDRQAHFNERIGMFPRSGNGAVSEKLAKSNLSKENAGTRVQIQQQSPESEKLGESVRRWCQHNGWDLESFYQFQTAMGGDTEVIRNAVEGNPNLTLPEDARPIVFYEPSIAATSVVMGPISAAKHDLNQTLQRLRNNP